MWRTDILTPPNEAGRSNGIDLLRGAFSLYVLLFAHVALWSSFAQGPDAVPDWLLATCRWLIRAFQSHGELNPAVLAFIVLSGFCIHRNGLRSAAGMKSFAIRRAFRILPVFWLASALGIVLFYASSAISPEKAAALTGTTSISTVCLVAKLTAVASLLPAAHPCDFLGNAPLLTVMVEIGLYAFYGFVFIKGGERLVRLACVASVIVGLIVAILSARLPNLYNWWQNSSLLAFIPYWWIGAAICVPKVRTAVLQYSGFLLTAWLVLTASTLWLDPTAMSAELRKLVLAVLVAWLILRLDTAVIPDNPFSLIGRAGYSIYALHAPIAVYFALTGAPWWLNAAICTCCGLVSFYIFENPIDRIGRKMAKLSDLEKRILESQDTHRVPLKLDGDKVVAVKPAPRS